MQSQHFMARKSSLKAHPRKYLPLDSSFISSSLKTTLVLVNLMHPEETSKNSDNCDLLKVPDIGKSIVVNGEKTISTIQPSSEKISWKYIYRKIY